MFIIALNVTLGVILLTLIILGLINKYLPRHFCDKLGWHLEPKELKFRGFQSTGTCPRCGKYVIQDSNGDWF